jgi:hypothetical protein
MDNIQKIKEPGKQASKKEERFIHLELVDQNEDSLVLRFTSQYGNQSIQLLTVGALYHALKSTFRYK